MRRRPEQEREEADAREQAEARRLALIDELKAREAAGRAPEPPVAPAHPAPDPGSDEAEPPNEEAPPATPE